MPIYILSINLVQPFYADILDNFLENLIATGGRLRTEIGINSQSDLSNKHQAFMWQNTGKSRTWASHSQSDSRRSDFNSPMVLGKIRIKISFSVLLTVLSDCLKFYSLGLILPTNIIYKINKVSTKYIWKF